ncbi:hypothetical protein [Streptosporangium carneum]|uniref:hypothetical protein n=1 Tax=Streptosporangium carneum TaxID=47481 RepID=UPI0022F2B903|nr:hypothetical protein [Streptosporangium carneum]
MITPRRPPPADPGALAERLRALRQAHPAWHITYDDGVRVWSALRDPFPTKQEIDAGVKLLIKTPSPERMDQELTGQAEILKNLPATSRAFPRL